MFGLKPLFRNPIFTTPFKKSGDDAIVPDPSETFFMLYEDGSKMLYEDGFDRMLYQDAP